MPWEFLKCPCFILLRIYCSTLKCFLLFLQETKNFRTVYSWWYIVHWLNHPLIFIHAKYIAVKNLCSIWIIQKIVPPPPNPRCPSCVTLVTFSPLFFALFKFWVASDAWWQFPTTSHLEACQFVSSNHTAQLCLRIVQWLEALASKSLDLDNKVIGLLIMSRSFDWTWFTQKRLVFTSHS